MVGFPSLVLGSGVAYMEITILDIHTESPDFILELGWIGSNSTNHYSGEWKNFISIYRAEHRENSVDPRFYSTAHESVKSVLLLMPVLHVYPINSYFSYKINNLKDS
jgi:hypothetical protein